MLGQLARRAAFVGDYGPALNDSSSPAQPVDWSAHPRPVTQVPGSGVWSAAASGSGRPKLHVGQGFRDAEVTGFSGSPVEYIEAPRKSAACGSSEVTITRWARWLSLSAACRPGAGAIDAGYVEVDHHAPKPRFRRCVWLQPRSARNQHS